MGWTIYLLLTMRRDSSNKKKESFFFFNVFSFKTSVRLIALSLYVRKIYNRWQKFIKSRINQIKKYKPDWFISRAVSHDLGGFPRTCSGFEIKVVSCALITLTFELLGPIRIRDDMRSVYMREKEGVGPDNGCMCARENRISVYTYTCGRYRRRRQEPLRSVPPVARTYIIPSLSLSASQWISGPRVYPLDVRVPHHEKQQRI